LCGHKGTFRGKEEQIPEYETTGLLGSNLEIFDPVKISEWNAICGLMGMDTISAGGTLAWAMEACEKGLFPSNLKFGSPDEVTSILEDIARKRGIGKELALGSRLLSKKYGGQDFAIQVKGLEMAAYDPRGCFGHGLSYAVANRGGCHLSAALWGLETYFHLANPSAIKGKPAMVKFFENIYSAVNSLHTCQFTAYPVFLEPALVKYTPILLLKLLIQNATSLALSLMDISLWPKLWSAVIGNKLSVGNYKKAGERIHILERYMNTREGISKDDDILPGRLLHEGRKDDRQGRTVPLHKMLHKYYKLRGYDTQGIPTGKTLTRLGIKTKAIQ
jgi:aldehyde:ferredoxin oxidoreductase